MSATVTIDREKMWSREDSAESIEAETARNTGGHVADHNRGASNAPETPPQEVRHLLRRRRRFSGARHEEIGDVRRRKLVAGERWIELRREVEEGGIAESGRVEPASGGIHQEVQRGDAVAEAGFVETLQGDGRPWGWGPLR